MVKIKGAGSSVRAADTSGVQRANESLLNESARGAQQAAQMGQAVQGAVNTVQRQGMHDDDMAMRKQRLDVEMAKGGLEYKAGPDGGQTIVQTEAAQQADTNKAVTAAHRAETERMKAETNLANAQLSSIKAGYTNEDGVLSEEGMSQARNLFGQLKIKQNRSLIDKVIKGDPESIAKAQDLLPSAEDTGEGQAQPQEGGVSANSALEHPMTKMAQAVNPGIDRVVKGLRALVDYNTMRGIQASGGVMPDHDDMSFESEAFQNWNSHRQAFVGMVRAGQLAPPPFRSNAEKNRWFNKLAAKAVLSGFAAPGSMADPSLTQGMVPSSAGPDTMNQEQAQQAQANDPAAGTGSLARPAGLESSGGPDWNREH